MSSQGVAWEEARAAAEERAARTDEHAALCREVESHARAAEVLRVLSCHVPARADELRAKMEAVAVLRDDALRRRDDAAAGLERQVVVADLYTELARYYDAHPPAAAPPRQREGTPDLFGDTSEEDEPACKRARSTTVPVVVVDSDGDSKFMQATYAQVSHLRQIAPEDQRARGIITTSQHHNQEVLDYLDQMTELKASEYDPDDYECGCFVVEVHY